MWLGIAIAARWLDSSGMTFRGVFTAGASIALMGCGASSTTSIIGTHRVAAAVPVPTTHFSAGELRPRPHAAARGTLLNSSYLFGERAFANTRDGFALVNDGSAQYPAITTDGGRTWRIGGPQVHIDAADGPEGVSYVGLTSPRTYFAYGSSAVDVTSNAGRTWWETLMGELVVSVVPGREPNDLVAYVQQSLSNDRPNPAVTWQYVTHDGGRHWTYSTDLGG